MLNIEYTRLIMYTNTYAIQPILQLLWLANDCFYEVNYVPYESKHYKHYTPLIISYIFQYSCSLEVKKNKRS